MNKVGTALFPPEPTEEHSLTIAQSFLFLRRLHEAIYQLQRRCAQVRSRWQHRRWATVELAEGAVSAFIRQNGNYAIDRSCGGLVFRECWCSSASSAPTNVCPLLLVRASESISLRAIDRSGISKARTSSGRQSEEHASGWN